MATENEPKQLSGQWYENEDEFVTIRYGNGEIEELELPQHVTDSYLPITDSSSSSGGNKGEGRGSVGAGEHVGPRKKRNLDKSATRGGGAHSDGNKTKSSRKPKTLIKNRKQRARTDVLATSKDLSIWPLPVDNDGIVLAWDESGFPLYKRIGSIETHYVLLESEGTRTSGEDDDGKSEPKKTIKVEEREVAVEERDDIDWFIAHNPSTATLTLSLTSLASTENFLSLLTDRPSRLSVPAIVNDDTLHYGGGPASKTSKPSLLKPLPAALFPDHLLQRTLNGTDHTNPAIHRALTPYLERHGMPIVSKLLELLETPPIAIVSPRALNTEFSGGRQIKRALQSSLIASYKQEPVKKVEIVGHGLGADLGLLIGLALNLHFNDPARHLTTPPTVAHIVRESRNSSSKFLKRRKVYERQQLSTKELGLELTLFGLSRVGNADFATWVDEMIGDTASEYAREEIQARQVLSLGQGITLPHSSLTIRRVSSFADPIVHLPAQWQGFSHFSTGEFWVDGDPERVWKCRRNPSVTKGENGECANSIPIEKTILLDHAGPYGAKVWIGGETCA